MNVSDIKAAHRALRPPWEVSTRQYQVGKKTKPRGPREPSTGPLSARYPGVCSVCHLSIDPGDMIRSVAPQAWAHQDCATYV